MFIVLAVQIAATSGALRPVLPLRGEVAVGGDVAKMEALDRRAMDDDRHAVEGRARAGRHPVRAVVAEPDLAGMVSQRHVKRQLLVEAFGV